MKIEKDKYVAIEYTLSLDSGEVVDKSDGGDPLGFIFGCGQIISGLENHLAGQEVGFEDKVTVEAAEGYGEHRPELVREFPREQFPKDKELVPGMAFAINTPHGPLPFMVKSVSDDKVEVDLNHALAGERLHFQVKVVEVREPNAQEKAQACGHDAEGGCGSCCGGCG